jgi:hypothetical protein
MIFTAQSPGLFFTKDPIILPAQTQIPFMKTLICIGILAFGFILIIFNVSNYYNHLSIVPVWRGNLLPYISDVLNFNLLSILGVTLIILSFKIKRHWTELV